MAAIQGIVPQVRVQKIGRQLDRYLIFGVFLILLAGLTLWFRPFWAIDRVTQARLFFCGMRSENVTIDGERIHFLAGGSGAPIVLVHGLGSRATDWVGLIPALVHSGRRVYAIDLLGYGDSARPANAAYSIQEEAHIVEQFLDAEHLQHVDLAGWSMGGWISMVVATEMPDRISRLVLLDSAGLRFQPAFDPTLFTPTDVAQLRQLEHLLSPNSRVMPAFVARAFLVRARPEAWVIHRSVVSMLTGQDLLDNRLGDLKMPTLIVWGKDDHLTPLSIAYTIHAAVPDSELDVIDGCGHLAPGLCANQIAPKLLNFLDHGPVPAEKQQEHATLNLAHSH